MSCHDSHSKQEEDYQNTKDYLQDLFDTEKQTISPEEEEDLLPLLNQLTQHHQRYEKLKLLAEGAEKQIFQTYDHKLNRIVAMAQAKKLKTRQDLERFLQEAHLEANLAHPNIMPIYSMGLDTENRPFFTMELIQGDSLRQILKKLQEGNSEYKEKYTLSRLLNIYLKVCDAIAHAHSRNVIHLDLKPDNIQVGSFGEVLLCDWGLSTIYYEEHSSPQTTSPNPIDADLYHNFTSPQMIKGTPGYMAPEQTTPNGHCTPQTDIYALGAILYKILTYKLPVEGESSNTIIANTKAGKIIPPTPFIPHRPLPKGLVAVAMKALSLSPEKRYASVTLLQQDIEKYLSGHPTTAEKATLGTRFSLLMKRNSSTAANLIISLFILTIVISIYMVLLKNKQTQAIAAQTEAEKNLALFLQQQDKVTLLNDNMLKALKSIVNIRDYLKPGEMLEALSTIEQLDLTTQQRTQLAHQKAICYFVKQKFNKAVQALNTGETKSTSFDLKRTLLLSEKYAKIKPNDSDYLSAKQLSALLEEAPLAHRPSLYLYKKSMPLNPPPSMDELLSITKIILDKINGTRTYTDRLHFTKDEDGNHLDLSGTPYSICTLGTIDLPSYNVLSPLNLTSLDISYTHISNLREVSDLHLKKLRMVGLNLSNSPSLFYHLRKMKVETLIIDADTYRPSLIKKLRKNINVINEPAKTNAKKM